MNNLDRRLSRLEAELGAKQDEPRVVVVTNVNFARLPENDTHVDLHSGDLWAYAIRGGPFTEEEIRELRDKYKGRYDERARTANRTT